MDITRFHKSHPWTKMLYPYSARALQSRWDRATVIYEAGEVFYRSLGQYEVTSQTDNTIQHRVYPTPEGMACTCPDFKDRAPLGWCKHRMAAWIADQEYMDIRDQEFAIKEERTQPATV